MIRMDEKIYKMNPHVCIQFWNNFIRYQLLTRLVLKKKKKKFTKPPHKSVSVGKVQKSQFWKVFGGISTIFVCSSSIVQNRETN